MSAAVALLARRRSTRGLSASLLTVCVLALTTLASGWAHASPATAAGSGTGVSTGATIVHAQPAKGALRLLVSVPGTGAVDLHGVSVRVDQTDVSSQAVAAASSSDVKRTSILAIDTSDSMRGARIAAAKGAAATFLDAVPANVRVGVLTFDSAVHLLVPPTLDHNAARTALGQLTLRRSTALYQGLLAALSAAGPNTAAAGQRNVLVLSDGKDTTGTPLPQVLTAIKKSGAGVNVVSLSQGDQNSAPLQQIAAASKGTMLNAADAKSLTAAFASEANTLAREIVVTATVPSSMTATSADVAVTVPVGGSPVTASAYVPVRAAGPQAAAAPVGPQQVTLSKWSISPTMVLGGVGALGVGLLGMVLALALGRPRPSTDTRLDEQMRAYGVYAQSPGAGGGGPADAGGSLGQQARQAAERALSGSKSLEARIASRLEAAGMALKPAEWLLVHFAIVVGAGLVGVLLSAGSIALGLIFILAGAVGPWIYLGLKKSKRLKAFGAGLADTLQLMSGSLSAGLSLAQSIDTIVREGAEPVSSEFRRVVVESRLGVTLEDSLEGVAERMESRDFEWVVMAIRIQREVGGNLAELLLTVAATLREREYLRRHVRALSAEGRLSCYILGGLPPAFLLYLTLARPDYVHPLWTTPLGWILDTGMALLLGVGIVWMMKVAKVDL